MVRVELIKCMCPHIPRPEYSPPDFTVAFIHCGIILSTVCVLRYTLLFLPQMSNLDASVNISFIFTFITVKWLAYPKWLALFPFLRSGLLLLVL